MSAWIRLEGLAVRTETSDHGGEEARIRSAGPTIASLPRLRVPC